ncbi:RDD family protein [Sporolactobacillus laevolacticus]|uniref:RDD family protein n=1 Tax=Sporolactobacillus laevolacticus TaxID=33018 RepID=UPI0025B3FB42|nr:RDD family protein [Sporolactobacillus laevolacticus]MDN3954052.1 RDD family protein [Sporolactobacillus laevolacticus]
MNQSEFIHELEIQLKENISEDDLREVLSDYESFFISGREEGRTDDQISAELGSPSYLAQSLRDEQNQQGRTINKNIASPGKRLCAFLIDSVIASVPFLLSGLLISSTIVPFVLLVFLYSNPLPSTLFYTASSSYYDETDTEVSDHAIHRNDNTITIIKTEKYALLRNFIDIVGFTVYLLYSLICTWLLHGQTLGKKLMHIRVRAATQPASKWTIFYREFLGKVLINSIPIVPLASLFTLLFTKEHKTLHDMLADTIVTND